jgi:hypothetical protein
MGDTIVESFPNAIRLILVDFFREKGAIWQIAVFQIADFGVRDKIEMLNVNFDLSIAIKSTID